MSDGLILNKELFDIERRCVVGTVHTVDGEVQPVAELPLLSGLQVDHVYRPEFIPQNVKTVSQLVYQINAFLRERLVKLTTTDEDFDDGGDWYDIPAEFASQPENSDWYKKQTTVVGQSVRSAVEAIYRSDGRVGFKFSPSGQKLFVLRLSAEGKRIFGWNHRYIAVDNQKRFTAYINPAGQVISSLPNPNLTESIVCVTANSIFNHGHYRHEIAVLATLPLQNYVECNQKTAIFKQQLASYRYPNDTLRIEYRGTMFKVLKESRKNTYMFEHANKTHNEFLLTGTDLQNFHIRLMARNYEWSVLEEAFIMDEKPYPLPSDSLWTISLMVTPLE